MLVTVLLFLQVDANLDRDIKERMQEMNQVSIPGEQPGKFLHREMKDVHCTECQLAYFAEDKDLKSTCYTNKKLCFLTVVIPTTHL